MLPVITASDFGFYVPSFSFKKGWSNKRSVLKHEFFLCRNCLYVKEFGVKGQDNKEKVDNFNIYFESSFSDSRFDSQDDLPKSSESEPKDIYEQNRNSFHGLLLKEFNMDKNELIHTMIDSPDLSSKTLSLHSVSNPSFITKGSSQDTTSALSESVHASHSCSFPVLIPSKNYLKRFLELKGKFFAYKNLGIPIVILFYFYFFI
jgi:hypothetical protein